MQFLKTLFWALLAGILVAFALNNMTRVPLKLWGTLYADVNLPLLLVVMFLVGFVPPALAYYTMRWRLRQRLAAAERAIADLRHLQGAPASIMTASAGSVAPAVATDAPMVAQPDAVAPLAPLDRP